MQKRKILNLTLAVLTAITAFFSWLSVKNAVVVSDSSTWGVPMLLFSIYAVLLCLDMMLFTDMVFLELLLVFSLALSLFFAFSWLQLGAVAVSFYFLSMALRKIRIDMDFNMKISPWKSMRMGKSYLIIGLALVITMEYFAIIKDFKGEKKVPHFDTSFITQKIALPFLSSVSPQFAALKDESLTVDQFILQNQNSQKSDVFPDMDDSVLDSQIPANLPAAQREALKKQAEENFSNAKTQISEKNKDLILEIGRKQFSDIVGVPVTGSEKISDIFTGLVNDRLNAYFNSRIGSGGKSPVLPAILATVLFLIIYPLSSVLSVAWFLVAKGATALLLRVGVLKVKTVTVTKESLE